MVPTSLAWTSKRAGYRDLRVMARTGKVHASRFDKELDVDNYFTSGRRGCNKDLSSELWTQRNG